MDTIIFGIGIGIMNAIDQFKSNKNGSQETSLHPSQDRSDIGETTQAELTGEISTSTTSGFKL